MLKEFALITEADYRNVVIFPEKFNGLYVRLDRPHSEISPWSIWISYSPDLKYWGDSKVIMRPVQYHWDEMKIGPGAPPIKTSKGWLSIYHGVFPTMDGSVYRLGVALHDLKDPSIILVSETTGFFNRKKFMKSPVMFIMSYSPAEQFPNLTELLKYTGVVRIK